MADGITMAISRTTPSEVSLRRLPLKDENGDDHSATLANIVEISVQEQPQVSSSRKMVSNSKIPDLRVRVRTRKADPCVQVRTRADEGTGV